MKKLSLITMIMFLVIGLFSACPVTVFADDEETDDGNLVQCTYDEGTGQCTVGDATYMSDKLIFKDNAYWVNTVTDKPIGSKENKEDFSYVSSDGKTRCRYVGGNKQACYVLGEDGNWIQTDKTINENDLQPSKGSDFVSNGVLYVALSNDIDDIWALNKDDIISEPIAWLAKKESYIVIKTVKGEHQVFWNVPNVQQSAVNLALGLLSDGYSSSKYEVETTENLIAVGSHTNKKNLMTELGFYIPNYTYQGEFPIVYLSMNQVLPSSIWQVAWKAVKMVISGESFIDAPKAETYNSMRYLGHDYVYPDENFIRFIEDYWQEYFVNALYSSKDTFYSYNNVSSYYKSLNKKHIVAGKNNEHTITDEYISDGANQGAKTWITEHFPRQYVSEGGAPVYEIYTNAQAVEFGEINREGIRYLPDLTDKEIHVEDITDAITPQIEEVIKADRAEFESVADYRCRIIDSTADAGDGFGGGVAEFNPVLHEDVYHEKEVVTRVEYYDAAQDPLTRKYDSCNFGDYAYGGTCVHEYEEEVDHYYKDEHEMDIAYWGSGGSHSKFFEEYATEEDIVPKCVEDYVEEYDKCVEGDDDAKKLCPIEKVKHGEYGTPGYATYTPSVGKYDLLGKYDGREGSTEHNYAWEKPTYRLMRQTNFNRYNSSNVVKFVNGVGTIKFFGEYIAYTDDAKMRTFPYTEVIDTIGLKKGHTEKGYNKNKKTVADFRDFKERWEKSLKASQKDKSHIYYNQCLIESLNQGQCVADADGSQFSLFNVYAQAQLFKINMDPEKPDADGTLPSQEILHQRAEQIIDKIHSVTGQYYPIVIDNLIQVIIQTAKENGEELELGDYVTGRVLPYNIENMIEENSVLVGVADPRYERSVVGKLGDLDASALVSAAAKEESADKVLSIISLLSEMCVTIVQWMSFEFLEKTNSVLSPTFMWRSNLLQILMSVLVIFFIIQVLNIARKFINGNAGLAELLSRFFSFLLILGILLVTSIDPAGIWSKMSNIMQKIMNLGETTILAQNSAYSSFLNGEKDAEVIYWTPYFDAWSLYNTGYGILDPEQTINKNSGQAEVSTVGGRDTIPDNVKLWSVLLAKSFVKGEDDFRVSVDNNAYRVVDHFMAPRVVATDDSISVTSNENYNGQFQGSILRVIPKIASTALILAIVAVKFMTFLYLWYMLYMLVFNIMMSLGVKGYGDLKELLKKTFIPVIQIFVIGLWSSLVIYMTARVNGAISIVIILGLWIISISLFKAWKQRLGYFPPTMDWLYTIIQFISRQSSKAATAVKNSFRGIGDE